MIDNRSIHWSFLLLSFSLGWISSLQFPFPTSGVFKREEIAILSEGFPSDIPCLQSSTTPCLLPSFPPFPSPILSKRARLNSELYLRHIPFGTIWQRWDDPHGSDHKTWIVQDARIIMQDRKLVIRGSLNREIKLSVRGGIISVHDTQSPPSCTHHVPTGIVDIHTDDNLPFNYWHFNIDNFYLLFHTMMGEFATGLYHDTVNNILDKKFEQSLQNHSKSSIQLGIGAIFASTVPSDQRLRSYGQYFGLTEFSFTDFVKKQVNFTSQEIAAFFKGNTLGDIIWLNKPQDSEFDDRVVCIDRLYVGPDRQCALLNEVDASADKGECHSVFKLWKAIVVEILGLEEEKTAPVVKSTRPDIILVGRSASSHGKRITNVDDVIARVRSDLDLRFEGNYSFREELCENFIQTATWWTQATIIIVTRGACQANMPLTRNGGGVLWIGPCQVDMPQIFPLPDYYHTVVYHPPVVNSEQCNWIDFQMPVTEFLASFDHLLDLVHGPAIATRKGNNT